VCWIRRLTVRVPSRLSSRSCSCGTLCSRTHWYTTFCSTSNNRTCRFRSPGVTHPHQDLYMYPVGGSRDFLRWILAASMLLLPPPPPLPQQYQQHDVPDWLEGAFALVDRGRCGVACYSTGDNAGVNSPSPHPALCFTIVVTATGCGYLGL
jgi:hypothetical protein